MTDDELDELFAEALARERARSDAYHRMQSEQRG